MILMLNKNKLTIIKKTCSLKFLNQNLMNIFLDYDTVCERSRSEGSNNIEKELLNCSSLFYAKMHLNYG